METNYTLHHTPILGDVVKGSLFFIPGMWNDSKLFKAWTEKCSAGGYQSWSIDLNHRKKNLSVLNYVAMVQEAINCIEEEFSVRPVLLGHSMGGLIVQRVASEIAVPAIVLMSSPTPAGIGRFNWSLISNSWRYLGQALRNMYVRGLNKSVQRASSKADTITDLCNILLPKRMKSRAIKFIEVTYDYDYLLIAEPDKVSKALVDILFRRVKVGPLKCEHILVVAGDRDKLVPPATQLALVKRYNASYLEFSSGHMFPLEQNADEILQQILLWLESR